MPYDVARALNISYPDAIGVDQLKRRNALAERDMAVQERNSLANDEYRNALIGNMNADNRRQDAQIGAAQVQEWFGNGVAHVRRNPQLLPQFIEDGIRRGYLDDEDAQQMAKDIEGFALQHGVAPAPLQYEQTPEYKAALQKQNWALDLEREKGRQNRLTASSKPPTDDTYSSLTPEEVSAANLPPGTSAQRNNKTGKIDVLGKRDTTGALSQKDATAAKNKLTAIKVARKQLEDIKSRFTEGRQGLNAFGPGQGLLPTEAGKRFDAAVNRIRSSITALTRTPGVGAMSDYETKLDQGKMPNRSDYETVTEDNIKGLDDLLSLLETGYGNLLSGNTAMPAVTGAEDPLGIR